MPKPNRPLEYQVEPQRTMEGIPSGTSVIWIIFLAILSLTVSVAQGFLRSFDLAAILFLQNLVPLSWDRALSLLSIAGSAEILTFILIALLLATRKIRYGMVTMGAYLTGLGVEIIGKHYIYQPAPPAVFHRTDIGIVFPSSFVRTHFAYPSGHMYRTTFLVITAILILMQTNRFDRHIRTIVSGSLILLLVVMAVSRVSLGEHWATDVIGGMLLGTLLPLAASRLLPPASDTFPKSLPDIRYARGKRGKYGSRPPVRKSRRSR